MSEQQLVNHLKTLTSPIHTLCLNQRLSYDGSKITQCRAEMTFAIAFSTSKSLAWRALLRLRFWTWWGFFYYFLYDCFVYVSFLFIVFLFIKIYCFTRFFGRKNCWNDVLIKFEIFGAIYKLFHFFGIEWSGFLKFFSKLVLAKNSRSEKWEKN